MGFISYSVLSPNSIISSYDLGMISMRWKIIKIETPAWPRLTPWPGMRPRHSSVNTINDIRVQGVEMYWFMKWTSFVFGLLCLLLTPSRHSKRATKLVRALKFEDGYEDGRIYADFKNCLNSISQEIESSVWGVRTAPLHYVVISKDLLWCAFDVSTTSSIKHVRQVYK